MSSKANIRTDCLVSVLAFHFRTFVLVVEEAPAHSAGTLALGCT